MNNQKTIVFFVRVRFIQFGLECSCKRLINNEVLLILGLLTMGFISKKDNRKIRAVK